MRNQFFFSIPPGHGRKGVKRMAEKLKKIECDPKCGFMVQSHEEKELIEIAKEHAKKFHNLTATDEQVKAMMKDA